MSKVINFYLEKQIIFNLFLQKSRDTIFCVSPYSLFPIPYSLLTSFPSPQT